MSPTSSEIIDHYTVMDERERLATGIGLLEMARTQELILRHLPQPPGLVVDAGGGPGAYAGWLSSLGYDVHLIDAVEKHVAQARELRLASAEVGDARRLPQADASADAVLLLGPLYDLTERGDRVAALREAGRVVRAGGFVFAAAITRYASLLASLSRGFIDDPEFTPILDRDLAEGQHRNHTSRPEYFTTAFFHRPDELRAEAVEAGLDIVTLAAVEGPGWLAHDFGSRWADLPRRQELLRRVREVESIPELLGVSPHVFIVARSTKADCAARRSAEKRRPLA